MGYTKLPSRNLDEYTNNEKDKSIQPVISSSLNKISQLSFYCVDQAYSLKEVRMFIGDGKYAQEKKVCFERSFPRIFVYMVAFGFA